MSNSAAMPVHRSLAEIAALLGAHLSDSQAMSTITISGLTHSSKAVLPGDLFLALPGAKVHGALFSLDAQKQGARAILTDAAGANLSAGLPTIVVSDPRRAAGILSAWFYGEPMRDMHSVGITGTNGKTTTSTILSQIWEGAGRESALIGTIETRIGQESRASQRTTPESPELQKLAWTMRSKGVSSFVMEVSSHALVLERVRGAHFSAVAFTNLTQDHLDFHGSMENYFFAKAKLFTYEYADKAFINVDDPYGRRLADACELPLVSISRSDRSADWHISAFQFHPDGMSVAIRGIGGILIEGQLPLHGGYNLDNALLAVALACESGIDPVEISALMPTLVGARGRMEPVGVAQDFAAYVDYAHSPDAVARVLQTCRSMTEGKVIAVLGCGGDRDASKRSLMGQALLSGSDIAIFTSDNPRSEDPEKILAQMTAGLAVQAPSCILVDRKAAIDYATDLARGGDLLIILGKGHESGQEIQGKIYEFDDRDVLRAAIGGR